MYALEAISHAAAEIFDPSGNVCLRPSIVIIVRGADAQRLIIGVEISRIIFFQRIQPLQIISAQMQDKRAQQPRRFPQAGDHGRCNR